MQIEHCLNPLGWSVVAGFILGLCWCATYLFSWVWAWSWAWIDDSEASSKNPVIRWVMKKWGWDDRLNSAWAYEKGDDRSDGGIAFSLPLLFATVGPLAMLLAVAFYPVTIGLICLYATARLTRFARRHKKLFDTHVKDPGAHKR